MESTQNLYKRAKGVWKLEVEKLKKLTFLQRIEYLWDYYKVILVLGVVVILAIGTFWTMFQNGQKEYLLSVVIVDGEEQNSLAQEKVKEDLLQLLGNGEKQEEILLDLSPSSNEISGNVVKTAIALSPIGEYDVAVCSMETYQTFAEQGAFKSWESVLGEDYKKYEPYMEQGAIDISNSTKWKELGLTTYSPAYVCVLKEGEHIEQTVTMLEYFWKEN